MNFAAYFNLFEAALWFTISAALFFSCWKAPQRRRPWPWGLPLAFFAFGLSDLIEVQSGAWWQSWWLPVLKAPCVAVFLAHAIACRRRKNS